MKRIRYTAVSFLNSEADFDDLPQQAADALSYLELYGDQLKVIPRIAGIDVACLDFGVNEKSERSNQFCKTYHFPSKLLKLVGDVGIDIHLSVYSS